MSATLSDPVSTGNARAEPSDVRAAAQPAARIAPAPDLDATRDRQFVTFSVAGEMFAVPMAPVQEIIRVPEVSRLPLAPHALDGLSNLRGRVLPIVDLRRLLRTEERPRDDATRALVIDLGQPLGFVVDRVASVVNVEPSEISPVGTIASVVQTTCLTGVIQRRASDGTAQILQILDFGQLVAEHFRSAAGATRRSGEAGAETGASGLAAAGTDAAAGADAERGSAAAEELRLVSFAVCGQEYAIDIAAVQEIVQMPERVTAVPNTPSHVLGLISLRERLLPLVSLRSLFALPALAADEQHRIVVVGLPGGHQVGLVTDSVKEVLSVPRHQAEAVPGVLSRDHQLQEFESICRLDEGRRLVSIIATDRLLGLQGIRDALQVAHAARTEQGADPADRFDASASAHHPSRSSAHEGAAAMAQETSHDTAIGDDTQVVIFRLGAEEFGVPIMSVQEIVRVPEVLTRVPRTPPWVQGVINLRGSVLPVIDQRSRLGMGAIERNDRQRIMVYLLNGLRTGFIVDSVAEVLRIGSTSIEPAPVLSHDQGRLITRVAKLDGDRRLVMLIEPDQLLGATETQAVQAMVEPDRAAPASLPRAA